MPDGLRLALTTLTIVPLRGPRALTRRTAGLAMELAPLVGLLLGLVAAAVLYAFRVLGDFGTPALLPAVLAIASLAVLTRGLHLDGLADLTDGLASSREPEGTRAVMKAPDVGPLGVAAVLFVVLIQVGALMACVEHGRGTASLVLAVVTGRLALTAACHDTPAATAEGLGAYVAQTVRRGATTIWAVALGAGAAVYATLDADSHGSDAERIVRTLLALALGLGAARVLRAHAVRRVGGLSGDVLGALCEIATTVCLVVLASGG